MYIKHDDPTPATRKPAHPMTKISGYVEESDNQFFLRVSLRDLYKNVVDVAFDETNRRWTMLQRRDKKHKQTMSVEKPGDNIKAFT